MAGPRMVVEAARLGGRAVGAVAGLLEPLPQLPPGGRIRVGVRARVRIRVRVRVGVRVRAGGPRQ